MIPIPEKDIIDPVAEYNRGELQALEDIETVGFTKARETAWYLTDNYGVKNEHYTQGYFDTVEHEGTREI